MKKRIPKKVLSLVISLALILLLTVGGTVAYVVIKTQTVRNAFQNTYVDSRVNVNGDVVDVTNTGNIPAYIRASIAVNWVDENGNVRGIAPTVTDYALQINEEAWYQDPATGFYYCISQVAPGQVTADLVTAVTLQTEAPQGYELRLEVVAEAIQAQGETDGTPAFQDAWGITGFGS